MKIEKMCDKQDLITNLKKAANYSRLEHLKKLAEYIQKKIVLDDLKENIEIESYEIQVGNGKYQIIKIKNKYDSKKNMWEVIEQQIIYEISLSEIESVKDPIIK